jgi:translocation and assembly module TamB
VVFNAAVCGLLVAGYAALGTQVALDYIVRRAVADAEGHLIIEGAEGSLLSSVRIARIAWRGEEIDLEASESVVAWSPLDLVSRKLIVTGLGAKRLTIDFKKAGGAATGVPATLALPLEVEVRNIAVERLEWKTVEQSGYVTGIAFGYAGGERKHAIDKLRFVTVRGTLAGKAELAAVPPYALSATLAFDGDGDFKGAQADLSVAGTLERIAIEAKGTLRNASVAVKAGVTPFAPALITSADIEARGVDLAQFAPALPATALTLTLTARPESDGFVGSLSARNEAAGALDAGRIPVSAFRSRLAWNGKTLALSDIDAELVGEGPRARKCRAPDRWWAGQARPGPRQHRSRAIAVFAVEDPAVGLARG